MEKASMSRHFTKKSGQEFELPRELEVPESLRDDLVGQLQWLCDQEVIAAEPLRFKAEIALFASVNIDNMWNIVVQLLSPCDADLYIFSCALASYILIAAATQDRMKFALSHSQFPTPNFGYSIFDTKSIAALMPLIPIQCSISPHCECLSKIEAIGRWRTVVTTYTQRRLRSQLLEETEKKFFEQLEQLAVDRANRDEQEECEKLKMLADPVYDIAHSPLDTAIGFESLKPYVCPYVKESSWCFFANRRKMENLAPFIGEDVSPVCVCLHVRDDFSHVSPDEQRLYDMQNPVSIGERKQITLEEDYSTHLGSLHTLPDDLIEIVFAFLSVSDLLNLRVVCRTLDTLLSQSSVLGRRLKLGGRPAWRMLSILPTLPSLTTLKVGPRPRSCNPHYYHLWTIDELEEAMSMMPHLEHFACYSVDTSSSFLDPFASVSSFLQEIPPTVRSLRSETFEGNSIHSSLTELELISLAPINDSVPFEERFPSLTSLVAYTLPPRLAENDLIMSRLQKLSLLGPSEDVTVCLRRAPNLRELSLQRIPADLFNEKSSKPNLFCIAQYCPHLVKLDVTCQTSCYTSFPNFHLWLQTMVEGCSKISDLTLVLCHMTDECLHAISRFPNLERLSLGDRSRAVSDRGLSWLGAAKRLNYLRIVECTKNDLYQHDTGGNILDYYEGFASSSDAVLTGYSLEGFGSQISLNALRRVCLSNPSIQEVVLPLIPPDVASMDRPFGARLNSQYKTK